MRFALLLLFVLPIAALAKGPCSYQRLLRVWEQEAPIEVLGPGGVVQPLSFSHDTEIPNGDAYAVLRTLPEFEEFKREVGDLKFTKAEIVALIEQKESVFLKYGLVESAKGKSEPYSIFDLEPWAFSWVYTKLMKKPDDHLPGLEVMQKALDRHLKEKGLRVRTTTDQHLLIRVVEVQHESSDTSPRRYREEMDRLAAAIPGLKPHYHVGIPAFIPRDRTVAIARAVEVQLVLAHAMEDPTELRPLKFNTYSPLESGSSALASRGMVKLEFNEFSTPAPAHDLEIRSYVSPEHAWTVVAYAGELARHYQKLKLFPEFQQKVIADPLTQNLNGSLRYAGIALSGSKSPVDRAVGEKLKAFADRIEAEGTITDEVRAEVRSYLRRNNVLTRLKPAVLLE